MKRFGITLIIIGIGAFILPYLGRQFVFISIFGPAATFVSIAAVAVGIILVVASYRIENKEKINKETVKCPSCGVLLASNETVCPKCNTSIRVE